MRKRYKFLAVALMAVMLAGCGISSGNSNGQSNGIDKDSNDEAAGMESGGGQKEEGVKLLTAEEAYSRIQSGDSVVIVDVRTQEEYEEGHIEGAVLIPNEEIKDKQLELLPVADAEILVYCRSGNRSAKAAEKLFDLGYNNVSDFGGIIDWPYGTVTDEWEVKEGTYSSFRSADIMGIPVDEDIFANSKITMINIWATYCGPCLREMPGLGELSEEYKSEDVQIVGIVIDVLDSDGFIDQEQVEYARKLAEDTGASYMHLLPSEDLISAGLKNIYSVPTTFLVNSEGEIVGQTHIGSQSKGQWKKFIDETMDKYN